MPYVLRRASAQPRFAQFQLGGGSFPGQGGNPVGFAAAPGFPGSLTVTTWPPALSGGDSGSPAWGSGTTGNPTLVKFRDFVGASGGGAGFWPVSIDGIDSHGPVNHVKFIGCRWQTNDNVQDRKSVV